MPTFDRRQLAAYLVGLALIALVGIRSLQDEGDRGSQPLPRRPATAVQRQPAAAVVHVAGAVRRPGVYRLRAGRVTDAIDRAGGPSRSANLSGINLAAKLGDGQQIVVPSRAGSVAGGSAAIGAPSVDTPAKVSLSTATQAELDTLDGVGPATAKKIVAYRSEHGGFSSTEELQQVPGIGEKKFAALKESVQP